MSWRSRSSPRSIHRLAAHLNRATQLRDKGGTGIVVAEGRGTRFPLSKRSLGRRREELGRDEKSERREAEAREERGVQSAASS